MKVIREPRSSDWSRETRCPFCRAHLEVEADDIRYGGFMENASKIYHTYFYTCGWCGRDVVEVMRDGTRREDFPVLDETVRLAAKARASINV
jgi:hypothetical protein